MIPVQAPCSCGCGTTKSGPRLIFSCSGAADVGELADRAARNLTREGLGKMFCLAGIGGRVSGILKTTEAATALLAIDGCPLDCAKKSLEEAGFAKVHHLRLSDLGFEKGQTFITDQNIAKVMKEALRYL
ncbi:MAG: putative zinc-binding protein [Desulforhopalus sp.]|nr:putative zinc-binding protein [Desulforhopalus sp.]